MADGNDCTCVAADDRDNEKWKWNNSQQYEDAENKSAWCRCRSWYEFLSIFSSFIIYSPLNGKRRQTGKWVEEILCSYTNLQLYKYTINHCSFDFSFLNHRKCIQLISPFKIFMNSRYFVSIINNIFCAHLFEIIQELNELIKLSSTEISQLGKMWINERKLNWKKNNKKE